LTPERGAVARVPGGHHVHPVRGQRHRAVPAAVVAVSFAAEIPDELGHATFLANKVAALGGVPVVVPAPVPQTTEARQMLLNVVSAEDEARRKYAEYAELAGKYDEVGLRNHLEDFADDETGHMEETEKFLRGGVKRPLRSRKSPAGSCATLAGLFTKSGGTAKPWVTTARTYIPRKRLPKMTISRKHARPVLVAGTLLGSLLLRAAAPAHAGPPQDTALASTCIRWPLRWCACPTWLLT
jgi:bacterioferritin